MPPQTQRLIKTAPMLMSAFALLFAGYTLIGVTHDSIKLAEVTESTVNIQKHLETMEHLYGSSLQAAQAKLLKAQKELHTAEDRLRKEFRHEGQPVLPRFEGALLEDWRGQERWEGPGGFKAMKDSLLPVPENKRLLVVWQAVRKGGFTGLGTVMRHFCAQMRLPVYTNTGPDEGIPGASATVAEVHWGVKPVHAENTDDNMHPYVRDQNSIILRVPPDISACVGVVRNFDPPLESRLNQTNTVFKVITMLRDPRDMIVSAYASYSKTDPRIAKMTVDEFALTQEPAPTTGALEIGTGEFYSNKFRPLVDPKHVSLDKKHGPVLDKAPKFDRLLISYNEMVLAYRYMLDSVGSYLQLPEPVGEMIYHATCCNTADSPVTRLEALSRAVHQEAVGEQIRAFLPGDHRQWLTTDTNDALVKIFEKELVLVQSLWSWDAFGSFAPPVRPTSTTGPASARSFKG